MPFITDQQLARVNNTLAKAENAKSKALARAKEKSGEIRDGLEIVGAAGLMGYVRGLMEKNGKDFVIPGTNIDLELVAGMGLVGAGMMDLLGKYDDDALMLGYGCLAHYAGQMARNSAKEGAFTMVAGDGQLPMFAGAAGGLDNFIDDVI